MRISDWSSDLCSADLPPAPSANSDRAVPDAPLPGPRARAASGRTRYPQDSDLRGCNTDRSRPPAPHGADRKSVVSGKSVSVRVDLGVPRLIKQNKYDNNTLR